MGFKPRICIICGKKYIPRSSSQKCCSSACSAINNRELRKSWHTEQKSWAEQKAEKPKPAVKSKSLKAIVKELAQYNKEHGTRLTYGQYVLKKEMEAKAKARSEAHKELQRLWDTGASEEEIAQFMREFGGAR